MSCYEIIQVVLSGLTLSALVVYTFLTYKMAKATSDNVQLTKELHLTTSFPLVTLEMIDALEPLRSGKNIDTVFRFINLSGFSARAWLTLRVTVLGKEFDWGTIGDRKYCGLDPWPVTPHHLVQGHFDFMRVLKAFNMTPQDIEKQYTPENHSQYLRMTATYKWTDLTGTRFQEGLPLQWYFDFGQKNFIFDI